MADETVRGRYSVQELEAMPTLRQSQADDLKVDIGTVRVWLSRATVADGAPYNHQVTVEQKNFCGDWKVLRRYRATQA